MSDEQRRSDAGMLPEPGSPQLVLIHSREPAPHAQRIPLGRDLLLIGRTIDEGAGVSTGDARMSRVHVRIVPDARLGGHRVGDAHSSNGTFVNGLRVDTAVLGNGDVLRIGDSVFVYCTDEPMQRTRNNAQKCAISGRPLLLHGEPGSGKRHFTETLHTFSGRAGDSVRMDCSKLTAGEPSIQAWFERAARAAGSAAIGGTLILEDVTACPREAQVALLRALEAQALPADVAVIAIARGDLNDGRLLAELWAYLAPATIELPPLRARKTELLGLVEALAERPDLPARADPVSLQLNANAVEALAVWPWPSNLAEVQALLAAAATTRPGRALDMDSLRELAPQLAAPVLTRKRTTHALGQR
jgi:transcriptional regulator of acetoin/glycerol metabolism